ncbi:hypothetical protein D3C78_1570680 [compost metagenome]
MPLLTTTTISTPSKVLKGLPFPPARDAPPTTIAVIAVNSWPWTISAWPWPNCATARIAASP